ncbi:MAG TPA: ASCH domain-containing protein [Stellaceae bacterium]|nr:ASCH domain-containing protein [Stellaceae bacterium]
MSAAVLDWRSLETFSFGDNPVLAEELAQLVLAGKKTATCWSVEDGTTTQVGKHMVMLDGAGRPRAVIETVELTQRRFDEVDAAFAFDEGENDRSLDDWRRAHERYFTRLGQFAVDMMLYCERFRVVAVFSGTPPPTRA